MAETKKDQELESLRRAWEAAGIAARAVFYRELSERWLELGPEFLAERAASGRSR